MRLFCRSRTKDATLRKNQALGSAAALLLTDYARLPRKGHNILRLTFSGENVSSSNEDWDDIARFVVRAVRADVARAGATDSDELQTGRRSVPDGRLVSTDVPAFEAARHSIAGSNRE